MDKHCDINGVEVFRTNVATETIAHELAGKLATALETSKISFDLEDCDRVLRVEGAGLGAVQIAEFLRSEGFLCEMLE